MAVCVWASPIPLHHPPLHGGQLSPAPLRCCKQIARSRAMRSAGSGPGPMSASVMGLFSMIHRDSVPCALVQPWGMSRHPGDGCDEGCRRGWMLCLMGAGRAAEGGTGHVAAAALPVAVQFSAALGSSSVLCRVGHHLPKGCLSPAQCPGALGHPPCRLGGCFRCCSPESY